MGNRIRIITDDGGQFNIFHMEKGSIPFDEEAKVKIKVGDFLGNAGSTGSICDGAHAHMELRYFDKDHPALQEYDDDEIINRHFSYYIDPPDIINP